LSKPPRIGSVWSRIEGPRGNYAIVTQIEHLTGTDGRFLVRVELFHADDTPLEQETPHWHGDDRFLGLFRREWTRYDMLRENEVLDDVAD